jgi:hypothetical protein
MRLSFVERAKELSADVIGMSALLTTTMEEQKKVIKRVRDEVPPYKTVVGGAPARSAGATTSAPTPTPRTPTAASRRSTRCSASKSAAHRNVSGGPGPAGGPDGPPLARRGRRQGGAP